jgi:spore coat polysaccharide biosynthesis protein SpsF (cytidylyltransferase family)
MRDPANGFRTARIACPIPSLRQERWTLDLPEDLAFLRGVARHLTAGAMPSLREVLRILEAHPELRRSELDEPRNAGYTKSLLRDRAAAEAQRLDSAGTGRRQ